jgi:hypothetical protein
MTAPVYHRRIKRPSSTGYGEKSFLDLCQSEVLDHIQVEMRQVWQLVCNDNGINDCRAIDSEDLGEHRFQFARLPGCKTMTAGRAAKTLGFYAARSKGGVG